MKNNYLFDLLVKKEIYSDANKNELFFSMLNLTKNSNYIYPISTLNELESQLSENDYFIAHNLVIYKGKKAILKGEIAIASKDNLLDFLKKSIDSDDLRNFLISPVFNDRPNYVIAVNDDSFYLCT